MSKPATWSLWTSSPPGICHPRASRCCGFKWGARPRTWAENSGSLGIKLLSFLAQTKGFGQHGALQVHSLLEKVYLEVEQNAEVSEPYWSSQMRLLRGLQAGFQGCPRSLSLSSVSNCWKQAFVLKILFGGEC